MLIILTFQNNHVKCSLAEQWGDREDFRSNLMPISSSSYQVKLWKKRSKNI